ncbi:hypothetical protein BDD12DRAFT_808943 [Trichophaea hybrida]|nr:hypothetical protein BDD12DRAFT_808943 [Trichophaea hybrida]
MDFYDTPFGDAYRLQKYPTFLIARDKGWFKDSYTSVITVSASESIIWVIVYTIILIFTLKQFTQLIMDFVLTFGNLRGRGNSESQLTDTSLIVEYLVVRPTARANPGMIYYPNVTKLSDDDISQFIQPLRTIALKQAVRRREAMKIKLRRNVAIVPVWNQNSDGPTLELSYNYTITGEDLGLQLVHLLRYTVHGKCETRYDWLNHTDSEVDDIYGLWGNFSPSAYRLTTVPVASEARYPPYLQIIPRSGISTAASKTTNGYEFAIVPFTSHRISTHRNTKDPWYFTENNTADTDRYTKLSNASYQIQRGRPPMFCWQKDTYSLGKHEVSDVVDLPKLPGLHLSPFLRDFVFPVELAEPPIVQIANNLGYDSTSSPTDINRKVINASYGNSEEDLTRLIQISYVSSREIVRNTVLLYPSLAHEAGISNAAVDDTGKVPYEYADFVLDSKEVVALSFPALISIPFVCTVFWLIVLIRINYGVALAKNTGPLSWHNLRHVALQATQLYRCLDELINGERKWSGRTAKKPFIRDIVKDIRPKNAICAVTSDFVVKTFNNNIRSADLDQRLESTPQIEPRNRDSGSPAPIPDDEGGSEQTDQAVIGINEGLHGYINRFQIYIQDLFRIHIAWWPLPVPRRDVASKAGFKQMWWKCKKCGRRFIKWVHPTTTPAGQNQTRPSGSISTALYTPQPANTTASNLGLTPAGTSQVGGNSSGTNTQPDSPGFSVGPQLISHPATDYVLLIAESPFKSRQALGWIVLPPLDSRIDGDFFRHLKKEYRRIRRWDHAIFTFRALCYFKFVKFHQFSKGPKRIVCLPRQEIPSHDNKAYDTKAAQAKPPIPPPPIDPALMNHFYNYPECADDLTENLELIPKRVNGPLPNTESVGWGLEAVEGPNGLMIVCVTLLLIGVAVWFTVWWIGRHPVDLQSATIVFALLFPVLTMLLTVPRYMWARVWDKEYGSLCY